MTYSEVMKQENKNGWFRLWDTENMIYFARRIDTGSYEQKAVMYEKDKEDKKK